MHTALNQELVERIIKEAISRTGKPIHFYYIEDDYRIGSYNGESGIDEIGIGLSGCEHLYQLLKTRNIPLMDEQQLVEIITAHELGHCVDTGIEQTSDMINETGSRANDAAKSLDEASFIRHSEAFKRLVVKKEMDAWDLSHQFLLRPVPQDVLSSVRNYCVDTYRNDCDKRMNNGLRFIRKQLVTDINPRMKQGSDYVQLLMKTEPSE